MLEEWRSLDCVFSPPKSVCLLSQTLHSQHCQWHHQYHHPHLQQSFIIICIIYALWRSLLDQSFPTSLSKQNPIQGLHLSAQAVQYHHRDYHYNGNHYHHHHHRNHHRHYHHHDPRDCASYRLAYYLLFHLGFHDREGQIETLLLHDSGDFWSSFCCLDYPLTLTVTWIQMQIQVQVEIQEEGLQRVLCAE